MSAFGTLQSQEAGGQSLTGAIVSKISQSRKKAKAKDKKEAKKSETKDSSQQTDNKPKESSGSPKNTKKSLFGNPFSKLKEKLSFNKKGKPNASREREIGGNATGKSPGLVKLLTKGFGVLATDTTQIQGNLSQITEALQRQLGIQDYTSNSVNGVQSILSDQLENQTAIIEALGGTVPTKNSVGGGGPSAFGSASSQQAGGKTITGALLDQIKEFFNNAGILATLGRAALPLLANPLVATVAAGAVLGYIAAEGIKNKRKFSEEPITGDPEKDRKIRETLPPTLGGTSQVRNPSYLPVGDPRRWSFDNPGKAIPPNIKAQRDAMPIAGPWDKRAAGGVNAMIGEAGKERVVDLHSRDAKNTGGDSTAAMQATGGSLLSVVNEFMKAMGPLGGPVSQAVGPQAAALAKDFDMSGGLLNFRMKGGMFKDNNDNKKKRDNFMKELVTDSLKALGAKGKEKPKPKTGPGPGGPGTSGNPSQQQAAEKRADEVMDAIPGGYKKTTVSNKDGTSQEIRESNAKIFGSDLYTRQVDTNGVLPGGMEAKSVKGPGIQFRPVEGTNGSRWYDVDGRIYSWQPGTTVKELKKDEIAAGWNNKPFVRKPDTGHVRVNQDDWTLTGTYQRPPAKGEYSYKFGKIWSEGKDGKMGWLTPGGGTGPFGGRAAALPPSNDIQFDSGGQVVTVNGERIQVDKNGYPSEDGYFNPFGYGSGIPNPFVSDKRRQALSVQRESARRNSPMYRGMEVLSGKRLITGGTTDQLKEYGYADGGGMIGPSWMPWNWGKLVDNQRNTNKGLGYNAKYSDVTDPEMRRMMGLPPLKRYESGGKAEGGLSGLLKWLSTPMFQGASKPAVRGLQNSASSGNMGAPLKSLSDKRRMYEELGIAKPYEKGGSAFGTMQAQGYAANPQLSAIEDTLKVLTIKMSKMEQPRSIPAAPTAPVGVVNESANQEGGMIINNIMAASGGGGGGMAASPNDSYRTADTAGSPDPSGTASLLNRSPYAVYR